MTYAIWLKHDNANLQLSHSKFYLGVLERECLTLNVSPLKPTRIRDEIIITGSPSGLTKDAVELKRVKVRANIIKCALNWDKDDVIFDIKFGDNYDLTSFGKFSSLIFLITILFKLLFFLFRLIKVN